MSLWRISQDGMSLTAAATAVPMPLLHTVELNAGTVDTDAGPYLRADWTWAPSALDPAQVSRLSRMWFDALTGICAHVQRGGGGLTPSDIAPARLSQQQIDELHRRHDIVDVLPLPPMQQGLLFHAGTAQFDGDDPYAVQLSFTVTGPLDADRLREAAHAVVNRHPHLAARFCQQFEEPVQIIPADPVTAWRYVQLDADELDTGVDVGEQIQQLCAAERAAVCDFDNQPAFRVALIRTAEHRHRIVLTNHHIVLDGWSMPILLGEIFATYHGQRLPATGSYRRFVTWLADQDIEAARAAWREVLADFDTPTLGWPAGSAGAGAARHDLGSGSRGDYAGAWRAGALMPHHSQHCAAGRVGAAADVADRPARCCLRRRGLGAARPRWSVRNRWWVCSINTIPLRARITESTTVADLLAQLQGAHNDTLEHQHLALRDIHRIAGHERLFDTVFVYENYPVETGVSLGDHGLAITEVTNRDYYHYPLAVQAVPGSELDLRIQFRTDVFDSTSIETLIERMQWVLKVMTADPTRRLSSTVLLDGGEYAWLNGSDNGAASTQPATVVSASEHQDIGGRYRAPATLVEQMLADIYAQVLGVDRVGVHESFFDLGGDSLSAMRAITAISTALDIRLPGDHLV